MRMEGARTQKRPKRLTPIKQVCDTRVQQAVSVVKHKKKTLSPFIFIVRAASICEAINLVARALVAPQDHLLLVARAATTRFSRSDFCISAYDERYFPI